MGDIKIIGEGKYAFTQASWFDPETTPVTAFSELETSSLEHVLANLAPVQKLGAWRVASAEYVASALARENGAYKFVFSAPGVHDNLGQVAIHKLSVTFYKPPSSFHQLLLDLKHLAKLILP